MRALVIDDSLAICNLLRRMLESMGGEVHIARSGKEGLEKLRLMGRTDLVMVDWNMPEMDGLDFVRTVRADPSIPKIPIVMVTSEVQSSQVTSALAAGANEYVMKPFTKDVIREKLKLLGIQ